MAVPEIQQAVQGGKGYSVTNCDSFSRERILFKNRDITLQLNILVLSITPKTAFLFFFAIIF